jgi:hypothetical protein
MHIGHFGKNNSSAPDPKHPPALRDQLRCGFRSVWRRQQFLAALGARGFPSSYEEEADFRPLLSAVVVNML